jgi:hypothetical protein
MADKDLTPTVQEAWDKNQWMSVKGLEIPINIERPIEALQSLLEAINAVLDFSLFVLDFIKAFVRGFLNPLLSIVKRIIALLKALLSDLRQIGFYFTSDRALFDDVDQLLGGFPAFERRMLARLTNEEDLNRPNFSPQSACFGLYIYGDTSIGNVNISKIIANIEKFINFFVRKKARKVAEVTNVSARGVKVREGLFSDPTGDAVEIQWQVASNSGANAVGGFIIEISTELSGYYLAYDAELTGATVIDGKAKRVRGLVTDTNDNTNLRIFGGLQGITETDQVLYNVIPNPNSEGIALTKFQLAEGKLQRTYFVPMYPLSMDNSQNFKVEIPYEDLPEGYDLKTSSDAPRGKIAIRVRTVGVDARKKIMDNSAIEEQSVALFRTPKAYHEGLDLKYALFTEDSLSEEGEKTAFTSVPIGGVRASLQTGGKDLEDVSPPSQPITINVTGISEDFRDMCFYAVMTAILRGYDILKKTVENKEVFVNPAIASLMPTINMEVMGMQTSDRYKNGKEFGRRVKRNVNRALDKAFETVRCTETLQQTLLDSAESITPVKEGIAEIKETFYTSDEKIDSLYGTVAQAFKKHFANRKQRLLQEDNIRSRFNAMKTSASSDAPLLLETIKDSLSERAEVKEARNLVEKAKFYSAPNTDNVLGTDNDKGEFDPEEEAFILAILNLLFGSKKLDGSSNWEVLRLFPQGIPFVEDIMGSTINFMETLQETLESFGKKILKAIDAIEDKIKRIQQIINLINMFLELLKGFTLELSVPLYALAHTANGTDELVTQLLSSGLKPISEDTNETHAAGMLLVAGGLPSILLEFLVKMLISEEE